MISTLVRSGGKFQDGCSCTSNAGLAMQEGAVDLKLSLVRLHMFVLGSHWSNFLKVHSALAANSVLRLSSKSRNAVVRCQLHRIEGLALAQTCTLH